MKKTSLILILCMLAALTGCGQDDTAEDSGTLDIQLATTGTSEESTESKNSDSGDDDGTSESSATTTTAVGIHLTTTTGGKTTVPTSETASTAKTGAVTVITRSLNDIPPSRGTVTIPVASNNFRTTKKTTTTTKTTKTTTSTTSTLSTSTASGTSTNTASSATGSGSATSTVSTSMTSGASASGTVSTSATTSATTTAELRPQDVTNGDITCKVRENGIEVIRNGKTVQLIEVDTVQMLSFYKEGITDPSTLINIMDYDFDGYDDLFIPQEIGVLNTFGVYMHYNPDTEIFEEWEEMAEISVYSWTDDNCTIHAYAKDSAFENVTKIYTWNDERKLVLINSVIQYLPDPENQYNIYIDYFEYPDGTETLVRREKLLFDDDHNITGTEEIPLEEDTTEE